MRQERCCRSIVVNGGDLPDHARACAGLALLAALRGAANLITGGFPLATFPDRFSFFGAGALFGIPFPVYVFAMVFVVM